MSRASKREAIDRGDAYVQVERQYAMTCLTCGEFEDFEEWDEPTNYRDARNAVTRHNRSAEHKAKLAAKGGD